MSLNSLTLALLALPSLLAQSTVAPIFECADMISKRGTSIIAAPVLSGAPSITLSQPVPTGVPIVLNPGAPNQEIAYVKQYTSTSTPYVATLQITASSSNSATLTFAHSAGELVAFESQEAGGYFGFFNPTANSVNFTAGSQSNFFSIGNPDRGQPSVFPAGVFRYVFGAPLPSPRDLIWVLNNQTTVARATPELACFNQGPVVRAESNTVAIGATTSDVRLGTVFGGAPGPYTAVVTGVFRRSAAGSQTSTAVDIDVINIRVENGSVRASVTASTAATFRHYYFILRVTDSAGRNGFATGFLEAVNTCPMTVSPTVLSTAFVNVPFNVDFSATGAAAPITYAMEGTLPAGLVLSETGQLSGTPLQTGNFPLALRTAAADGCFHRTPLTLEVQGQLCSANVTPLTEITLGGFRQNLVTRRFQQTVTIRNSGQSSIFGPMALVTDNLSANAALVTAKGTTTCAAPLGRPYALAELGPNNLLPPGATTTLTLEFTNAAPTSPITYTPRVLAGGAIR